MAEKKKTRPVRTVIVVVLVILLVLLFESCFFTVHRN